jgi:hypothetical protein
MGSEIIPIGQDELFETQLVKVGVEFSVAELVSKNPTGAKRNHSRTVTAFTMAL